MPDLHRLPQRFGDAGPWRVDQRPRRRARDEDARQIEQQRRVLVAARVQPGQRHQQFTAAHVGIADQVEGGIGRDETVAAERTQQMRAAGADHGLDFGDVRRARHRRGGLRLWMRHVDRVQEIRHRLADLGPVRLGVVARPGQRLAQGVQPRRVVQFGKTGPAQQRPQRRIAERGPVELAEMGVAAGIAQQQGIADVIQRRSLFPGRQRAPGAGEGVKSHEILSVRCVARTPGRPIATQRSAFKLLKKLYECPRNTNVMEVTASGGDLGAW